MKFLPAVFGLILPFSFSAVVNASTVWNSLLRSAEIRNPADMPTVPEIKTFNFAEQGYQPVWNGTTYECRNAQGESGYNLTPIDPGSSGRIVAPCADLSGMDLSKRDLSLSDFRGANMRGTDMRFSLITGVQFGGAVLAGANLHQASSEMSSFVGANMRDIRADQTNFNESNFHGADMRGADLRNSKLAEVQFTDADLTRAKLESAFLIGAVYNQKTRLPISETVALRRGMRRIP